MCGYNGRITNVLTELTPTFEQHPEVKLVYLFGSRVEGTAGPLSDYDFAVYLDERDPLRMADIQLTLLGELQHRLGTNDVDVVILNLAGSPELKYDAIANGKLIYECEPFRVLVEPRILNEYFDFHDLMKRHGLTRA